ncbi:MAG: hypothetical protein NTY35_13510 [Planctomycetota bacterium]|nr:hypothetical protein [Planctomycetota bacterium]
MHIARGLWIPLLSFWLALAPAARAGDVPVGWKEKEATTGALHAGLPKPAFDAIARWTGFCAANQYRMDLDAQGRVLVLTPVKRGQTRETLRIVGQAETWFDGLLPPVPRSGTAPAAAPSNNGDKPSENPPEKRPAPAPLPEDPEGPPPSAPKSSGTGTGGAKPATPPSAWGSGAGAPDSQTAVLIILHDEKDHGVLLDHLEGSVAYLKDWVAGARKQTGLTLEDPLLGAFIENASGQEEWNGDHEVLNRVVQLLTLRRFGQQPNWIVQGLAWEAEMALFDSVYCFPYRAGFVFATEHTSWPSDLRIAFKDRAAKPLQVSELAGWQRGTWNPEAAPIAWGFVRHLAEAQKSKERALSTLLEDLRRIRDEKDRQPTGANTWKRIDGWTMPAEEQEKALVAAFGKDVFKKATVTLRGLRDIAGSAPDDTKAKAKTSPKGTAKSQPKG